MVAVKIDGGKKLDEALKKISAAVGKQASVDVGFQNGATELDGTLVAAVAAFNEYGGNNRPPRPFFRQAIEKNAHKWPINLGTALKRTNFNAAASLGLVGLEIKSEIEQSIIELVSPPLAESTIARKSRGKVIKVRGAQGPSKPLIDTGTMLKSVTVKVNAGE